MSSCIQQDNSLDLHPNIEARARALREGREMPDLEPAFASNALPVVLAGAGAYDEPMVPIPPDRTFRSAPDAVDIPKAEIQNFEPLRPHDARVLYGLLKPHYEPEPWGDGWPADDERWTLTPHQVRKLRRKRKGV